MDKYIILLPLNYNDGSEVSEPVLRGAIDELYALAGGYSIEGEVKGAYRMKDGRKQEDLLLKVAVMIPSDLVDDMRALVREFCGQFQQECIWLEKSNSVIELIEPDPLSGDTHD